MKLHLKTSFDNIKRAPFQAMAAISVLAITFFVTTLTAMVVYSSEQLLQFFESRPQVIAFLTDDADALQVENLQVELSDDPRVNTVNFVSKEDALAIYKEATSENPLLGELVSPSIFPASLEISPMDLTFAQELLTELKDEPIVESVGFTASIGGESAVADVIERLKTISSYIRISGIIAVTVLSITSFLVLMVVIGMRILMKKEEIESLSLIGATPGFIRAPLIFEAIQYAFWGVFIGWLMASVLIMYASPTLFSYFGEIPVLPSETSEFFTLFAIFFAAELIVGLLIALIGSFISVSRSLTMK